KVNDPRITPAFRGWKRGQFNRRQHRLECEELTLSICRSLCADSDGSGSRKRWRRRRPPQLLLSCGFTASKMGLGLELIGRAALSHREPLHAAFIIVIQTAPHPKRHGNALG